MLKVISGDSSLVLGKLQASRIRRVHKSPSLENIGRMISGTFLWFIAELNFGASNELRDTYFSSRRES